MLGKEAHKMIFTPPRHLRKPIQLGFYAEIFSQVFNYNVEPPFVIALQKCRGLQQFATQQHQLLLFTCPFNFARGSRKPAQPMKQSSIFNNALAQNGRMAVAAYIALISQRFHDALGHVHADKINGLTVKMQRLNFPGLYKVTCPLLTYVVLPASQISSTPVRLALMTYSS